MPFNTVSRTQRAKGSAGEKGTFLINREDVRLSDSSERVSGAVSE
jgi:hypothetical protein